MANVRSLLVGRENKLEQLRELAAFRQRSRWPGFCCLGDFHAGAYESLHVSPYSRFAGNAESEVLLLLQDWCSAEFLAAPFNAEVQRLGYSPSLPTNRNLAALLERHFQLKVEGAYVTNLFPFVKRGDMSRAIPKSALLRAAQEFALPEIRVVSPRVVVCFGLSVFNAVRGALLLPTVATLGAAIASPFQAEGVAYWAQSHPGHFGRISRERGRPGQVEHDWSRMRACLAAGT